MICYLIKNLNCNTYFLLQVYDTPESTRAKKWSSRLKLNTSGSSSKSSEKSPESPYMYGTISGPGGSALSKSMKYAETWLYGSVRTQTPPMRPSVFSAYQDVPSPVLISTPQKPTPHNYAVILCSCPEYLNGTKKSNSTKVSICKKCRGSRLPLTIADAPRLLVGGTVRGPQINRESGILRSGTVRVQSSKSRPSILKSQNVDSADPYDLMRRSRLAPPHETRIGSQFSTTRSRAKSISPCRVRPRKLSPSPSDTLTRKNRSKSVSRVNDIWVDEINSNLNESKKSILSCDINPYDLVKSKTDSKSLVEIDFDDDFNDSFINHSFSGGSQTNKSNNYSNVKAISGQRIRISDEFNSCTVEEVSVYAPDNIKHDLKNLNFKTREISTSISLPNIKNENRKSPSSSNKNNKKVLTINTSNKNKPKSVSPKRPPRRTRASKTDDDSESDNQRIYTRNSVRKTTNEFSKMSKHKSQSTDTIKSILKKPRNYDLNDSNNKPELCDDSLDTKRNNSSQFYLPTPSTEKKYLKTHNTILQRKRVQFLVENDETKILYTTEFNLTENTTTSIPGDVSLESEEDIVAQGDIVSHSLKNSNTIEISELNNMESLNEVEDKCELATINIKADSLRSLDDYNSSKGSQSSKSGKNILIVLK